MGRVDRFEVIFVQGDPIFIVKLVHDHQHIERIDVELFAQIGVFANFRLRIDVFPDNGDNFIERIRLNLLY